MEAIARDLARPFPLNSDRCAQFRHDGHILLEAVASAEELDLIRPLVVRLVEEHARKQDLLVKADGTLPLFFQATNLWLQDESIREFVCAKRFARIAAELMGVKGVRLYHDQALIKEPGGFRTPWHKDHYNWPLATHHAVKMWLALSDIDLDMGVMRFASGTHRSGMFPEVPISYDSEELFDRIIQDHKIPVVSYKMKAGDASFHLGGILHAAMPNTSTKRREVLAVIYYEDGTRIMVPNHEHRRVDLAEYLPGLRPGDPAAGRLTPLLYVSGE